MAGNPFRRSVAVPADVPPRQAAAELTVDTSDTAVPSKRKVTKKVRIQSPIVSPDEPQDDPFDVRLNPGGHPGSPPPLDSRADIATELRKSFIESVAKGASSLNWEAVGEAPPHSATPGLGTERLASQAAQQVPYNPFAKTLATIEQGYGISSASTTGPVEPVERPGEQLRQGTGKGTMDVNAFTRMLLTGDTGTASPVGLSKQTESPGAYQPGSSSLMSEYRRPSLFEPMSQLHPESPQLSYDERSSYEENRSDEEDYLGRRDENLGLMGTGQNKRPKPPPPQNHHGRLLSRKGPQTVSFDDFEVSVTPGLSNSPVSPSSPQEQGLGLSRPISSRSVSDLNKPLPPPPGGSSSPEIGPDVPIKDDEITSINELEDQIGHDTVPRRVPPVPPMTRRSSQSYAKSGRARSGSNLSKSSVPEDFDNESNAASQVLLSQPVRPPPPPTRRLTNPLPSGDRSSSVPPIASEGSALGSSARPPPPPPSRGKKGNHTLTRTPSSQSASSIGTRRPSPSLHQAPPPPPPRRSDQKRLSADGSRYSIMASDARRPSDSSQRGSMEMRRLSGASWNSGRTPSLSSLHLVPEDNLDTPIAKRNEAAPQNTEHDILGDMAAFQREIDELRAKVAK
ncbi:hypothetical protein MBLNU459_g7833t3 [Dothideomycetes sp. NU459]